MDFVVIGYVINTIVLITSIALLVKTRRNQKRANSDPRFVVAVAMHSVITVVTRQPAGDQGNFPTTFGVSGYWVKRQTGYRFNLMIPGDDALGMLCNWFAQMPEFHIRPTTPGRLILTYDPAKNI